MTREETLIKEALEQQAAQAPDAARVRAALAEASPRTGPSRRLVLVPLAALAAAAVVVTPLVVFRGDQDAVVPPPAATSSATTTRADFLYTGTDVPLGWGSLWLPAGFTETERSASGSTGDRTRTWRTSEVPDQQSVLTLSRVVRGPDPIDVGVAVDVAGVEARLTVADGGDKRVLQWAVDGENLVLVGVRVGEADFLKVARSVAPDPLARLTVPMTAQVPGGLAVDSVALERGDGGQWVASVSFTPGGRSVSGGLTVRVRYVDPSKGALTPGLYQDQVLVAQIQLDADRTVRVERDSTTRWSEADTMAVARSVKLLRDPDLNWG